MTIISFLTLLAFMGWTYVALAAASVTKHVQLTSHYVIAINKFK